MRRRWGLIAGLILASLLAAAPGPSADSDTLERNRQRLEKWKTDPEHYVRLMTDLKGFFALPPERQRQLRELDAKMHAGDLARQTRLWGVLERYGTWLDGLVDEDRRRVLDAPGPAERLEVIRFLRDKEWVDRAPPSVKAELGKLPPEARRTRIAELRAEERRQRRKWDRSLPAPPLPVELPKPAAFDGLPPDVKAFVRDDLLPAVPEDRVALLAATDAERAAFLGAVARLTRAYLTYRPLASGAVAGRDDLPKEARKLMVAEKGKPTFRRINAEGWPEYALAFEKACRDAKLAGCPPLGLCHLKDYPSATQAFVKQHLAAQAAELTKLEGHWPQFPDRLVELARAKGLVIPGMMLPGPAALWAEAR